jgi:methylglutaconyl-CoA hydratase
MTNPIADPLVEGVDTDANSPLVRIEATQAGVATLTINRAVKRNAFDAETVAALAEAFETLQGAEGVRVVFLRGAGLAFSAGADAEWMRSAADHTEADNREDAFESARMMKALWDIPALTCALVHGPAFGGGAGLVAACDLAVATSTATFAFSEVKLGLVPGVISPYVVNAIGPRAARALFATGRVFEAAYAEKIGLITEVVPDVAGLAGAAERIAAEAMACAPGAVEDAKRLVADVTGRPFDHALMEETSRRIARARISPEGQEGVAAFLEKRRPSWMD